MNRAQRRGAELRRELRLRGRVDADAVAASLGLSVRPWWMEVQREFTMAGEIVVAARLNREWRRWMIAHAICHHLLHPGNHLALRAQSELPGPWEREADQFACALLVDAEEARREGLVHSWEIAEHFGVPDELVREWAPFPRNRAVCLRGHDAGP